MSVDYNTAWLQGEDAARAGLALQANPYDACAERDSHAGWRRGFLAAVGSLRHTAEDAMLPPQFLNEDDGHAD